MKTLTQIGTDTTVVASSNVQQIMASVECEMKNLIAFSKAAVDFDLDAALLDASILTLNGLPEALKLQYYLNDELVREHCFRFSDTPIVAYGPPAGSPPTDGLDRLPSGCRIRFVATRHPSVALARWEEWLSRLGWVTAKPLVIPPNMRRERYGAFASGGIGVYRDVACNPKYDWAVEELGTLYTRRETNR